MFFKSGVRCSIVADDLCFYAVESASSLVGVLPNPPWRTSVGTSLRGDNGDDDDDDEDAEDDIEVADIDEVMEANPLNDDDGDADDGTLWNLLWV